jgi:RNA polymerase sporulation-specific sigma factor
MTVDVDLFERAKKGDPEARERVFRANTGLVGACIRRYAGLIEKEDLFQIGAIGLLKAIDRFDPKYGAAFSTYAVPLILGEIRRYLRDDGAVKVSRRLRELSLAAKRLSSMKKAHTGKEPSMEELARELEVEVDLLCQALESTQQVLYLEDLSATTHREAGSPQETRAPVRPQSFLDSVDLRDAVSGLDDTMRAIIEGRFFHGKTQHEIARELNLSQAHVSRLEKRALLLLRQALEPQP